MADSCDICGYKSSEVKSGGAISERGRRLTLHVKEASDLSRDVIKSETANVRSSPFLFGCQTTWAKTRLQPRALTVHIITFWAPSSCLANDRGVVGLTFNCGS